MKSSNLSRWIKAIINTDAMTFEDAYWGTRPSASEAVPEIIRLLDKYEDPYTRGKLIELLGECEDKSVIPFLVNELQNPDESIRSWAKGSIEALERGEKWQKDPKYL
ncbi:HEAT repeat domain-containing protein [Rheinheimera hassiensis]|uniref:HEAT repeat domain-containing protein n=1 Tax=Rheinheimera hassiensis TaxID=1193627 RepID=UPI001F06BB40|nr:HEAT repeat domain-containing protein [Rheinheimera hassiensis]